MREPAPPKTREGTKPRPGLELDLIGRKLILSDNNTALLLGAAESDSGASLGARDLATRLRDLDGPQLPRRRKLVLTRPETRALQRVLEHAPDLCDQAPELTQALQEILGH